jgi:hypothetical protein
VADRPAAGPRVLALATTGRGRLARPTLDPVVPGPQARQGRRAGIGPDVPRVGHRAPGAGRIDRPVRRGRGHPARLGRRGHGRPAHVHTIGSSARTIAGTARTTVPSGPTIAHTTGQIATIARMDDILAGSTDRVAGRRTRPLGDRRMARIARTRVVRRSTAVPIRGAGPGVSAHRRLATAVRPCRHPMRWARTRS